MNVGRSIQKSIDDWEIGDFDAAMLHACNAVDGTAAKWLSNERGSNARFTRLLRDNYAILGRMCMPCINLVETRFPINVLRPKAPGGKPDLADVIYGVHRCCHGHGDELPDGFELLSDGCGEGLSTRIHIEKGKMQLSDRVIFGLIAVAVLCPANANQSVPDGYYITLGLTCGASHKLMINEWWGRAADFLVLVASDPLISVTLDFGDWMDDVQ
jgi:hypothetical protein